jgi:hypothetical protein
MLGEALSFPVEPILSLKKKTNGPPPALWRLANARGTKKGAFALREDASDDEGYLAQPSWEAGC